MKNRNFTTTKISIIYFRCGYVEIPSEYSIEIDSMLDLTIAEQILSQELLNLN